MSYENAPATKLLATNCACCGRALVDAASIERGTGPDCAEKFGVAEAQGEPNFELARRLLVGTNVELGDDARDAVNKLVHLVARSLKSIDRAFAQRAFSAIHALGFVVLAERIAKRFSAAILDLANDEETRKLRAAYAKIRADYCYDNAEPAEFDAIVRRHKPATPAEWVSLASNLVCDCKACVGSGIYANHGRTADCYRCGGKGYQSQADVSRNRAYDRLRGTRAA